MLKALKRELFLLKEGLKKGLFIESGLRFQHELFAFTSAKINIDLSIICF